MELYNFSSSENSSGFYFYFFPYASAALSRMLRHSEIPWEFLLCSGISHVLKCYGITDGTLAPEDSEKKRLKNTKRISDVRKMKDKKTDGYLMG